MDPPHIQDSTTEDTEDEDAGGNKMQRRFTETKKSVRPSSTNNKLLELLYTQHEEDRNDRERHLESLEVLLKEH